MNNAAGMDLLSAFDGTGFTPAAPNVAAPPPQPGWLFDNLKKYYHYDLDLQPHARMLSGIETALGDCSFSSGGQKLLMRGYPRGTYKSTIAAIGVPTEVIAHNPNARCLVVSYRHSVAKRRLKASRRHMEIKKDGTPKNPAWVEQYGDDWAPQFKEETWSDDAYTVMRRTDVTLMEPSFATAGVDRSEVGGHYDYICVDDVVNDRNCRTPEMRQMVYDYIISLLPILSPNGVLVMIYTTWDPDDAYARIKKQQADALRKGEHIDYLWDIDEQGAILRDSSLFFPRVLTHEFLNSMRHRMGSHAYSAQYLLKPIAGEDRTFNMDVRREVRFEFAQRKFGGIVFVPRWANERRPVETTLAWDPAGVKYNRKSDFHGLTVVGCDPLDNWWVLEAKAIKGPPLSSRDADGTTRLGVIDAVINLITYYRPHTVSCEDVAAQLLWLHLLRTEWEKRGYDPDALPAFHEYSPGAVPKNTRIQTALQPRWERGGIIIPPWLTDLTDQIQNFTLSSTMSHEDILDSLVQHEVIAHAALPDLLTRPDENPVDREALARLDRITQEESSGGTSSSAGMLGTTWLV